MNHTVLRCFPFFNFGRLNIVNQFANAIFSIIPRCPIVLEYIVFEYIDIFTGTKSLKPLAQELSFVAS